VQGFKGAVFGAGVALATRINVTATSLACVPREECVPMGGYSVWASMPPLNTSAAAPPRGKLLVLSHWDSQGLFRSIASVRAPAR
jgi:nicastrin